MVEIQELPKRFLRARTVRVKKVPATNFKKGWGVRCRHSERNGERLWGGEVGQVETRLIEGNGWDQLELVAVFEHCRVLSIGELVRPDDEGPTADLEHGVWRVSITTGDDLEYFTTQK